uniref:Retrovirus-related Pol polyprotein LINE-1 n=1 Tax=Tanacetum cinerariifolium TaxID=118510 RepID=A0A6L2LVH2_TANCI|nr:retrovirus-related Pol polyprotein LINE-1 [Tanacetum cinerariifolium]
MKLWERVIERRLRKETSVSENQLSFMPERSSVEAIHLIRSLMKKYRERQKDLHMAFLDLKKAYDSGGSSEIKNAKVDLWRRPQSSPVRRVEALVVDGLRRRGRPKLRWEDRVKHDMKELLLFEDMTFDRNELVCSALVIILLCALWDFCSTALCMDSRLCRMVAFRVFLLVLALPALVFVCLLCAFVLCVVAFA